MPHRGSRMRWCSLIGASCGDASEAQAGREAVAWASDTAQQASFAAAQDSRSRCSNTISYKYAAETVAEVPIVRTQSDLRGLCGRHSLAGKGRPAGGAARIACPGERLHKSLAANLRIAQYCRFA
ncbi:hypothetical protein NA56DRAFT_709894 [Hyaloscypha hepaticicola]|uniref:Uncharacterized protein n=1 Tax=Hyaloscypha hepaticicola TaxID=2082293 RepID=A0A2J6PN82_9HELO|nr:hypothetical protein NA56DRAFT_709894 [Hyaloscypha hepaticicola]